MKDQVFGVLQRIGKAFMLPIALLPVAGLFLGIGASFTNETVITTYNLSAVLGAGTLLNSLLLVMKAAGDIVFGNLPILFAIAVALAMANKEKATAALSGAVGFFIMHATINSMMQINGWVVDGALASHVANGATTTTVGILTLNMGVFGGIIVGLGVGSLTNKFYNIKLPDVLAFFSGTRFVPIITAFTYLLVGIAAFFVWPFVQSGIAALSDLINSAGYIGTFFYGLIERSLIPFGLHHVFYLPFWQTSLGGTLEVCGKTIEGGQNIFFAQLACPTTTSFDPEATKYLAGKFPVMMFGLPAAALAMYHTAKIEKRKVVGGLLFSAAVTAFLTGITEPLEFTFLFVAPVLYVVHALLAGLSFMLMHMFSVGVGQTFSGGFIDFFLFGILQGNAKTNYIWIIIVGLAYVPIYYFLFRFLITKFNFATPGREDDDEDVKLYTRADYNEKNQDENIAKLIVDGLGGAENIVNVDNCITRLRVSIVDNTKLNESLLEQSGSLGVVKSGTGVQIIYGPKVTNIKAAVDAYLGID
ncbi:MAG: PTS transporter subunit EIIC [Culicoidibacterales bacterium]